MRRPHPLASCFLPLASCFLLLLAVGCASPPTAMPPTAVPPRPTATPPAAATPQATVSPTRTPTVAVAAAPPAPSDAIDLGVPAGDTYDIRNAVVDREHGLLYVLGREGDVSRGGGVLAVVDLAARQVRATVPLPAAFGTYGHTPSLALSPDGTRLYLAGGEAPALWVLDSDTAGGNLGAVQATRPGVWSLTLDPAGQRLYVVEGGHLWRLDAQTLDEELAVPLPDLPQYVTDVRMAVDQPGQWLYLAMPYATSVAVYRTDDLSKAADILIEQGATVVSLVPDPQRARVYVLSERHIESEPYTVNEVAVLQGQEIVDSWAAGENLLIGRIVSDELSDRVLLLGETEVRTVDPDSGQILAVTAVPSVMPGSLAAAFVWQGQLYRLTHDGVLAPISLDSGQPGAPTCLGIALVSAALDEAAGRLYVLDSCGTVHVLDTASLAVTDTWPGVLGPGLKAIGHAPLTVAEGRLYVPDWENDVTVVLDAATGERLAVIPRSGQITLDASRQRLFLSRDGVTIADATTFQVTGSIADTVRQTQLVEPSAWATLYDSSSDQLFVTMSNNSPGSSASTWLYVYDGETLTRQDSPIKTSRQFLSGLAVDGAAGRLWLASHTPFSPYAQSLTAFTLDGQIVMQWQGLAGQLFADTPRQRLYVARAGGLFALDMASGDLIGYRSLDESPETLLFERQRQRLYAILYRSADLLVLEAEAAPTAVAEPVGMLPAEPIRHLAVDADGTALAVPESGGLFRADGRRWLRVGGGLPTTGQPRLVAAPDVPGLLFAFAEEGRGYGYGLFRSADGGRSWRPSSRGLRHFAVWDVALSPRFAEDGTALLAGAAGLFRSTDGGETWASLTEIPGNHVALALDDGGAPLFLFLLRERQADGYPVYAPVAETGGVERIGLIPISSSIAALALSPDFAADGLALIATWSEGLWRTQDGGRTWQFAVSPSPVFAATATILFSPRFAADHMLYVLAAPSYFGETDTSTLLRSSDDGATWETLASDQPAERRRWQTMAVSPPHDEGYDLVMGSADGQVLTLDPSQAIWETLPQAPPWPVFLPGHWVNDILVTPQGDLWFGAWGQGVSHFDGQNWTTYTTTHGLVGDHIGGLALTADGLLWAGNNLPEGVSRFDGETWTPFPVAPWDQPGLHTSSVFDLAVDGAGHLWVGGGDGAVRFDGQTWQSLTSQDDQLGSVYGVAVGANGELWFATTGGLARSDGTQWAWVADSDQDLGALDVAADGTLYALSWQTAWRLSGDHLEPLPAIPGAMDANALTVAPDGAVWVGSRTGAHRFDGAAWTTYTVRDGLPANGVSAIAVDRQGNIWLGTEKGVARAEPSLLGLP